LFSIGVLISGGGTNLQSIIDSIENGYLNCSIKTVISDREGAFGLERAKAHGIETHVVDRKLYKEGISREIERTLGDIDLVVLAGFLSILDEDFVKNYENKIINIHPSLIPSFCGKGMYGLKVHREVIDYGVKFSGCTVHYVDKNPDAGPIILQKVVPVYEDDTAETLQKRVLIEEHKALPEAIKLISEGKVKIHGRKILILRDSLQTGK